MTRDSLRNEYFTWLYDLVCGERFSKNISYRKLLAYLHDTEFIYLIAKDANRAEAGTGLRYRFALDQGYEYAVEWVLDTLEAPCSVLEMLVALAVSCEENIMDDPIIGDRTGQWFWSMVTNLGLGSMHDGRFDKWRVENAVARFLNRDYEPNGKGGLFTIPNCNCDLRDVEIWCQLLWYLDGIM